MLRYDSIIRAIHVTFYTLTPGFLPPNDVHRIHIVLSGTDVDVKLILLASQRAKICQENAGKKQTLGESPRSEPALLPRLCRRAFVP